MDETYDSDKTFDLYENETYDSDETFDLYENEILNSDEDEDENDNLILRIKLNDELHEMCEFRKGQNMQDNNRIIEIYQSRLNHHVREYNNSVNSWQNVRQYFNDSYFDDESNTDSDAETYYVETHELIIQILSAKIQNINYILTILRDDTYSPGIHVRLEGPIERSYRWHSRRSWIKLSHEINITATYATNKIINNSDLRRFIGEYI